MILPQDTQISSDAQLADGIWEPFPDLPGIQGGFSSKLDGGMSWAGAAICDVVENRRIYFKRHGLDLSDCVAADQVHGTRIAVIDRRQLGRGAVNPATRIPATDGLITTCAGIVLTTLHADCAPVFFAVPASGMIGLAHIGWRGAIAGLGGEMIERLCRDFRADPMTIRIAVGPMISSDCYVVGRDVADAFRNRFGKRVLSEREDGIHLDVFTALISDIERALNRELRNVPRPACTASSEAFWSYRRDGALFRSMMAWLTMAST